MKKLSTLVVLAGAALALVSTGCNKKAAGGKLKIGIVQLVEHVALDASYQGFVDGLKEAGYVDGENITIDYQNAQGEQANCVTIANKLVNDKDDVILAIATPAAQAVANETLLYPKDKATGAQKPIDYPTTPVFAAENNTNYNGRTRQQDY